MNILLLVLLISFIGAALGFWEKYCIENISFTVYLLLRSLFIFIITISSIILYLTFIKKHRKSILNKLKNITKFQLIITFVSSLLICIYIIGILYGLYILKDIVNYLILFIVFGILYIPIINYFKNSNLPNTKQIIGIILSIISVILLKS
tara:strand:- start:86 stop:535 length:450 start_codon:yes stop_codon:yes gene_type:complete